MSISISKCNKTLMVLQKYHMEDILCVICIDMLKDFYQGQCGCLYCKECFELYFNNCQICPGKFEKCKIGVIRRVENNNIYEERLSAFLQLILQMNEYFSLCVMSEETERELILIERILYIFQQNYPYYKLDINQNNQNILENFFLAIEELRKHIKSNHNFTEKYICNNEKKFDFVCPLDIRNNSPKSLYKQPNFIIKKKRRADDSLEIARFNWIINNFWEIRDKNRDVCSDSFLSTDKQYEMRLYFYPNGSDYHNDWQFGIRMWMEDGPKPLYQWPFIGYMTITLKNKSQEIYKSLRKKISIDTSLLNPCGRSDLFNFNYSDISHSNGPEDNSIIIECSLRL